MIVVLGAGVVGLGLAWKLVRAGASVTVVTSTEDQEIGWGSVAWSNASSKVRLGYPDHYTELNQAGMLAGQDLAAEIGGRPWLHQTGAVEVVAADDMAQLAEDVDRLREQFGYPAEMLDASRFAALMPGSALRAGEAAAHFPTEAWIDAPALVANLMAKLVEAGCAIVRDTVVGFDRTDESLVAVHLASGTRLEAEQFAICAGAWTGKLAALGGIDVPVLASTDRRVPGLVASITAPDKPLGPILITPEVIVRPFGPNRALLAGDSHGVTITADSHRDSLFAGAEVLLERARARLPQLSSSAILDVRLGIRSIPSDGLTIAGRPESTTNAYVLATHSGFTLAPILGSLAAAEIVHDKNSERLTPYRLSRFANSRGVNVDTRPDSASA